MDGTKKFETERTRRFRSQELNKTDDETISCVEEFGCQVLHIKAGQAGTRFSYTIGIYDTAGTPEIITVGLLQDTAHHLLNEAAERMRSGVDLSVGRHADLIGSVDCEFRPVDRKWVKHVMPWADWYYDRSEFPVLQAVYPDGQNRFPEDEGFDPIFSNRSCSRARL